MKLALVALVLVGAVACEMAAARSHSSSLAWRQFKQQHGKVYATPEEDARRFAIFMANKQLVERHNANASRSFDMALNRMADWTDEEKSRLNGARIPDGPLDVITEEELAEIIGQDGPVPDEVDWRKVKGRVSNVKDQGMCGSCWVFSTTGLLEGQELVQNMSSLVELSEKEILDCSKHNNGCKGGWPARALDDLANEIGGIESEADYPYDDYADPCTANKTKFVPLTIKGYKMLPKGDEETLKKTIANYGPVAIVFHASSVFGNYVKGVFTDGLGCDEDNPNHAVLFVGYGTDPKEGDYWLGKNSWGNDWGEKGYFRIQRGANLCGVANYGTLVTFK